MTPYELQMELIIELKKIFLDYRLKNSEANSKQLNIFAQSVPINSENSDTPEPYIIVRLENGKIISFEDAQKISVLFLICICDRNLDNQGHCDIFHIINKIYERFAKNSCLNNKFFAIPPFEWTLQDSDTYPYFFGGLQMFFEIPAVRKEDIFLGGI